MNAETQMHHGDGLGAEPTEEKARCGDCCHTWPVGELVEPKRLSERLDPGGVVPAGECPGCGALAYPLDELEKLAAEIGYSDGADGDDEGGVDALIDYKNALEDRCRRVEGEQDRAEAALTQCQHIAYEALVRVEGELAVPAGRLTSKELRRLARYGKETLRRVNSIAEGGAADPDFVAMLARAEEIIPGVTVGDVEGDPPVPRGCTGYRGPDGGIAHDNDTCPIHESGDPVELDPR